MNGLYDGPKYGLTFVWVVKQTPIADPASEGANGMCTDLKYLYANTLATPLYAQPPPRHMLSDLVIFLIY